MRHVLSYAQFYTPDDGLPADKEHCGSCLVYPTSPQWTCSSCGWLEMEGGAQIMWGELV